MLNEAVCHALPLVAAHLVHTCSDIVVLVVALVANAIVVVEAFTLLFAVPLIWLSQFGARLL